MSEPNPQPPVYTALPASLRARSAQPNLNRHAAINQEHRMREEPAESRVDVHGSRRLRVGLYSLALLGVIASGVYWAILEYTPLIRGYVANEQCLRDAVDDGDIRTVREILRRRSELVNMIWAGAPPLYEAAQTGQLEAARVLVEHGADVDFVTPFGGMTPLMGACLVNQTPIAEFLLERGARVNPISWNGETALDMALESGDAELIELLRKHGAKTARELIVGPQSPDKADG